VNKILTNALQQLDRLPAETSLIIIHPIAYRHQRQLTQATLERFTQCLYLALPKQVAGKGALQTALQDEFKHQLGLDQLKLPKGIAQAAQQVAQIINAYPDFLLLIEHFDRLADPNAAEFIGHLVALLTPQHHVMITSRHLPVELMQQVTHDQCSLLPSLPQAMLVNYCERPSDKVILEVYALGPNQVFINGRSLKAWDGQLPRSLFFYLVDRGLVTRSTIFETFWPSITKREATNVFHVTKRKINEILGHELTLYRAGFYHLNDKMILYYDVLAFQEFIQEAEIATTPSEAQTAYEQAIRLYHGHFLNGLQMPWIAERQSNIQMIYADALTELGHLAKDHAKLPQALNLYARAFANAPLREDLARQLMTLYHQQGLTQQGLEVYYQLKQSAQHHGLEISQETQQLAHMLYQAPLTPHP
jgi:DNA-binding SARP family transcriptional activator